jgi:hypothetical protein
MTKIKGATAHLKVAPFIDFFRSPEGSPAIL